MWNSGSTVNGSDANWASGEPSNQNGDEDCASLNRYENDDGSVNYQLNDTECYNQAGGICQISTE